MASAANDVAQLIKQQLGGQAPHLLAGLSLGGKVALQLLKQMVEEEEAEQQQQQQIGGQYHHHGRYEAAPPISPPEDQRLSCSIPSSSSTSPSAAAAVDTATPADAASETSSVAQQPPFRGLPQQVWVLDSQPGTVPLDVDAPTSVGKIIQLIHEIPTPLPNRQALYKYLEPKGIPLPVAQWLGTSLVPGGRWANSSSSSNSNGNGGGKGNGANSDQQLDWVFDIQGAAALYNSYR
jgi:hypothetical protein